MFYTIEYNQNNAMNGSEVMNSCDNCTYSIDNRFSSINWISSFFSFWNPSKKVINLIRLLYNIEDMSGVFRGLATKILNTWKALFEKGGLRKKREGIKGGGLFTRIGYEVICCVINS